VKLKFISLLAFTLLALQSFAQISTGPSQSAGRFYATAYGKWTIYTVSNTNAGGGSVSVDSAYPTLSSTEATIYGPFERVPLISILIDSGSQQETVSLTSVSGCGFNAPYGQCTLFGTFTKTHGNGARITSGSLGLQDAINVATTAGGGVVVVDTAWASLGGTTAMITGSVQGNSNVSIEDNRGAGGTGSVIYTWNGSSYAVRSGGGGFLCGTTPVPGLLYWDGTACQLDGGATFDSVNLIWNFEAIISNGTVTAPRFVTSGPGGVLEMRAQSAPSPGVGLFDLYIDTTTGLVHCRNNAAGDCLGAVQFVTSGSTVLAATLVTANGGCNVYSSTATGATSSNAGWPSLHGVDISTITGYLPGQLIVYPPFVGTNLISFKVCNPTTSNITPASPVTVFWDIR
jgi:hypothetical protein